ncbi:MAG: 2-oxoglutarate dehydrogenase complex dihydrolipoyllysine-residue succinyltransferase, partial [Pseudomonadota bacterium]
MAIHDVKVPQLSESVAEATLLQWKKKPGDAVAADEILIEIETDKVVLEVPAPSAGVITEIVKSDGGTVVSGEVIAKIDSEAKASAAGAPAAAKQGTAPVVPAAAAPTPASPIAVARPGATIVMPSAAKMIAETGVTPAQGTGKDGRITKADVIAAQKTGAASPPP